MRNKLNDVYSTFVTHAEKGALNVELQVRG